MAATNIVKYTVVEKNGRMTNFIVGPRLDYNVEKKLEIFKIYKISRFHAALSVLDQLDKTDCAGLTNKLAWFPWAENKYPTEEVIFGSLMTLRHWVENLKRDEFGNIPTIYIHCAAGTHRSPTILGFYLKAFDYLTLEICPLFAQEPNKDEKLYFSNAEEYANTYLEDDWADNPLGEKYKQLLKLIKENFYGSNTFLENMLNNVGWDWINKKREYGSV